MKKGASIDNLRLIPVFSSLRRGLILPPPYTVRNQSNTFLYYYNILCIRIRMAFSYLYVTLLTLSVDYLNFFSKIKFNT